MADIHGVIPLRPDNGQPAGFEGHIHFFTDREKAARFCPGAELSERVLTDCRWRERPTCPGDWIDSEHEVFQFDEYAIGEWGHPDNGYCGEGPYFGPIPAIPKNPEVMT